MKVNEFFEIFLKELTQSNDFDHYYKFHLSDKRFKFRKAYFVQRLTYLLKQLPEDRNIKIMDIGCGYGTTAIFLALNGYKVNGITLEFYYEILQKRLRYWSQYGDISGFTFEYKDLFSGLEENKYDVIIAQDTLHHLEPLNEALQILAKSLKPDCPLIVIEENGSNWVQNLKLIKQRGFKKVKTIYDEALKKEILIGDENIRSLKTWDNELQKAGLNIDHSTINYIRYYYPGKFSNNNIDELIKKEYQIQKKNKFLKNRFFFGLNFVAIKN